MIKFIRIFLVLLALTLTLASCEQTGGEATDAITTASDATEAVLPETTAAESTAETTTEAVTEPSPEVTTESPADTTVEVTEPITEPVTEPVTEPPHEHLFGAWSVISSPTCTSEGREERVCACGERESRAVAAVGHSVAVIAAKPATCTESGLTEGKHCSVCLTVIVAQKTVSAAGHKTVTLAAKPATCTESGLTEGKQCAICGKITVEQKIIPAQGHKEVIEAAKPATCTESGLTEGRYCSVCTLVLAVQKTLPATGHSEVVVKGTPATDTEYGLSDKIYCKTCLLVLQDHRTLFPQGFGVASNYHNDYGYNSLAALPKARAMQTFYSRLDAALSAFHEDVSIDVEGSVVIAKVNYWDLGLTYDEAISVYMVYKCDHPLYYWISNSWSYTVNYLGVKVSESYVKGSERARCNELVYSAMRDYMSIVEGESSVYHITLGIHDAIVNAAEYAYEADGVTPSAADRAHNVIGILEHGAGVCESYTELFALVLNYCDINNVIVRGIGNSSSHSWNLVELDDGKWYWYDLTWAETSWYTGVSHTSFCVNDTEDPTEHIGRWTLYGYPFLDRHTPYSSETFGKAYCYALPERSDTVFYIDDTMLYDTFEYGGTKYMVIGYDTVYCDKYWGADGNLPETLTYNGRTYKVVLDK